MLTLETQTADNFEDLTGVQFGWEFQAAQLGPVFAESRVDLYRTPNVAYSRFRFNCSYDQRLHARAGLVSFGLLDRDCPPAWLYDQAIPTEALIVFPRDDDMKAASPVGFRGKGIHFNELFLNLICRTAHHMPLDAILPATGIFSLSAGRLSAIYQELTKWQLMVTQDACHIDAFVSRLEESLALVVLDGVIAGESSAKPGVRKSESALKLALQLIHDSDLAEISATQLCRYSGGSQRSLEKTFRTRFGVTPKRYIKCLRIARVRRDLLNVNQQDSGSIIELAGVHGFWHMGQFAADYRKIYGELPSETVRKV